MSTEVANLVDSIWVTVRRRAGNGFRHPDLTARAEGSAARADRDTIDANGGCEIPSEPESATNGQATKETEVEDVLRVARSASRTALSVKAEQKFAIEDGQLVVRGDTSGARRWLVHVGPETVTLATGWKELSNAVGERFELSRKSTALLLRFGFVPVPHTLFANVFQAGIGDRLSIDLASGMVTHTYDFPFLIAKSRQSETWHPEVFTDLLCASCERVLSQHAGLLLSAGKDSTALLLALRRIGRKDVLCVTYDARYREQEAAPASALARDMGFRHVTVSADPRREFDAYMSFLRNAPHLTLDFSLPGALVSVAACGERGDMVLDGLGNDKYMHCSPSRRERLLRAISIPSRLRGLGWGAASPPGLGQRATYVASSAAMYASERWFPGTKLSAKLINHVTGSAETAQAFARSLDLSLRDCHIVDAVTVAKACYSDFSGAMEKTRCAAEHFGMSVTYPFCDSELIEYYFNLPKVLRLNEQTLETKIAFKRWLREQQIKSEYFTTKGSFRYNMATMFEENYQTIVNIVAKSQNIEFMPSLRRLFKNACHDYVRAQQAYLIFSLIAWADFHGFTLAGSATNRGLPTSN
jgi:asparagine synthetase B (glutamine-hydrolysing)